MTSFPEFLAQMQPRDQKITLMWEVLPALDGTLHAVDPDPDSYHFADMLDKHEEYSVSLCGKTLVARKGVVLDSDACPVCVDVAAERQREFDLERGAA